MRGYQLRHLSGTLIVNYSLLADVLFAEVDVFELASVEAAVFELESLEASVFEFASELLSVEAGASDAVSGFAFNTETFPVSAGIESNRADSINNVAALIVTFDRTVAVPRGANAELETLLVKRAPASVLPGCSNTAAINTRHERKNIPYKK